MLQRITISLIEYDEMAKLMGAKGFIFAATRQNFDQLVLQNSRRGLVLVDFWSPRAGPSLRQREILARLADEFNGRFLLATVNTDEEKQLAKDYAVHSLPSFKLFRHGKVSEEIRGMQPEADYRKIVQRHLAKAGDPLQASALRAWRAGEQEKALQLLAEGAMEDPENPAIPLLMAKLLMQAKRIEDAHALLSALPSPARDDEQVIQLGAHLNFIQVAASAPDKAHLQSRIESAPDDHQARYQLAAILLTEDAFEASMEQLMAIERQQPNFQEGAARNGLMALFNMLDTDDERVKRFRNELFRLRH
jgi:putative thioredoxin